MEFVFYEGPPFATGKPHYGHALSGFIKDAILRFKALEGFKVNLKGGWDCHGVPVEYEIQKSFSLKDSSDIHALGMREFNNRCRGIVFKCTKEWHDVMYRVARWIDYSNPYMTMDKSFMEGVWSVFAALHDKGLMYEGEKVLPYSVALETPLSNFEISDNYKIINRNTVFAGVAVDFWNDDTQVAIWTTLPWTCITNLAIGIDKDITYVRVIDEKKNKLVLAKFALKTFFNKKEKFEILDEFTGDFLVGKSYSPFFDFYKKRDESVFKFIDVSFIEQGTGTGVVSLAPAFGDDDCKACREAGIEDMFSPIDSKCCFTKEIPDLCGICVNDSEQHVIEMLIKTGSLIKKQSISHQFPFCPRSDTPIVYRSVKTWFLNVTKIKSDLIVNNDLIRWYPEAIGKGRFANWLKNAKDWAISRNRYWGTPIPVWKSTSGTIKVIRNIKELESLSKIENISDLHRENIDNISFSLDGEKYTRCSEVFDCWFESGSVPICQFGNHEDYLSGKLSGTADFISEGIDQTRGWFYTLMVISTALFNKPAFRNVVVNGTILASDGMKMSKRLKNYPEILDVVNKHGADALRLYLLSSSATKAEDIKFSEVDCIETIKTILAPAWQAYNGFYKTYINMFNYKITRSIRVSEMNDLDKWIVMEALALKDDILEYMNEFNLQKSIKRIEMFINNLNNWYIRLSRRRFWDDVTVGQGLEILRFVLLIFSKMLSSFAPFISEYIYQGIRVDSDPVSVHLMNIGSKEGYDVLDLLDRSVKDFEYAKSVINLGRASRKAGNVRLRQPLSKAKIITRSQKAINGINKYREIIKSELNIDVLEVISTVEEFVHQKISPRFDILGPILGKNMPQLVKYVANNESGIVQAIVSGLEIDVTLECGVIVTLNDKNMKMSFTPVDYEGYEVVGDGCCFVFINTAIDKKLMERGIAREVIHQISSIRKLNKFNFDDSINIKIFTDDSNLKHGILNNMTVVREDTQCSSFEFFNERESSDFKRLDEICINDIRVKVLVDRC